MNSQASAKASATPESVTQDKILMAWGNISTTSAIHKSLGQSFDVSWANHGKNALATLESEPITTAILDARLPSVDGYTIARQIKAMNESSPPQVLLVVQGDARRAIAARDAGEIDAFLVEPFTDGAFLSAFWEMRDRLAERRWDSLNKLQASLLKVTKRNIKRMVDQSSEGGGIDYGLVRECSAVAVEAARSNDLQGVLEELKNHHSYTFVHSLSVASLMAIFGAHIGLGNADVEMLAQAGLVHDLGKAMVCLDILDKPAKLNDEEWENMRRHPRASGEILRATRGTPPEVLFAAERHHEKLDGSGYPFGLSGAEIDDVGRISAICDVYSALIEKRAYKAPMEPKQAAEILTGMAGHHLDPDLVPRFLELVWDGKF